MSPQSEGRPSTERPQHLQDSNYGSRALQRQRASDPNGRYSSHTTNGLESVDGPKQQLVGATEAHSDMSNGTSPLSPSDGQNGRNGPETEVSQENLARGRSRTDGNTAGSTSGGTPRMCTVCGEPLIGKYVRALKGTFHLECFMCRVGLINAYIHAMIGTLMLDIRIVEKL